MKILVAGDWHSDLHEEPVYRAFQKLGHEVRCFAWHEYFRICSGRRMPNIFDTVNCKFQNKYMMGPRIAKLNRDLIAKVQEYKPHVLFIYRGTHIAPAALRVIKNTNPETILVGYNNDDPFSKAYPWWKWRHFLKSVPEYDLVLAFRQHNLNNFRDAGARRVELLRSWFVPETNHPVILSPEDRARFECDVVFVGHYEDDERIVFLDEIVKQGFNLRIFGPDYPKKLLASHLQKYEPIKPIWGDDYNKALCGAKVALCFLSKLNRDTYTQRCFEIPATRTMMLSVYTDDLASLFREGEDADFFRSSDELISKLRRYLQDDDLRNAVSEAGYRRVYTDKHDVVSRMRQVLSWIQEVKQETHVR